MFFGKLPAYMKCKAYLNNSGHNHRPGQFPMILPDLNLEYLAGKRRVYRIGPFYCQLQNTLPNSITFCAFPIAGVKQKIRTTKAKHLIIRCSRFNAVLERADDFRFNLVTN